MSALVLNAQGQPVNGWWGGKYYLNGVDIGPFKLYYNGGSGYEPFSAWGAPFGLPDQSWTDGIPSKLLAIPAPVPVPIPVPAPSPSPASSPSPAPAPSSTQTKGSYPNPNLWCADGSIKVLQNNDTNDNPQLMVSYPLAASFCSNNNVWDGSQVVLQGLRGSNRPLQLFLSPPSGTNWSDVTVSADIPGCTVSLALEYGTPLPPLAGGSSDPLWVPGDIVPDALIPFVDPYSGNTGVPSFSVPSGKTIGVWINVLLGDAYTEGTGSITVSIGGIVYKTIPVTVKALSTRVLPAFNSLPSLPKACAPLYSTRFFDALWGAGKGPVLTSPEFTSMLWNYQKAFHSYGMDVWLDQMTPPITWDANDMPVIDWTAWDTWCAPALKKGFFPDGTCLRVINSIIGEEATFGVAWSYTSNTPPPAQVLTRCTNLCNAITAHLVSLGANVEDVLGYPWDEPGGKTGTASDIYQVVLAYMKAMSGTGVKSFLTDSPYALNLGATPVQSAEHTDLVPFVDVWCTNPEGYVPSLMPSTSENWTYQVEEPFIGNHTLYGDGVSMRVWWWLAEYYGLKGIFVWCANFWPGNVNGDPNPTDATMNPYIFGITDGDGGSRGAGAGDGILCYPGSQLPLLNPAWPAIDGPVMSIRMEQWREGMQDAMVVEMLKAEGKTPAPLPLPDPTLPFGLNPNRVYPYWNVKNWLKPGNWPHDPESWDTARIALITALG